MDTSYMRMKYKNHLIIGIVLIFILVIEPTIAMPKSTRDSDNLLIFQAVIQNVLSTLPSSVKTICILDVTFDGDSQVWTPFDLGSLDERIVIDNFICDDQQSDDPTIVKILYSSDIGNRITQIAKPSGERGKAYERAINYHYNGKRIVSTAFLQCNADINIYVFDNNNSRIQLTESATIGSLRCLKCEPIAPVNK